MALLFPLCRNDLKIKLYLMSVCRPLWSHKKTIFMRESITYYVLEKAPKKEEAILSPHKAEAKAWKIHFAQMEHENSNVSHFHP